MHYIVFDLEFNQATTKDQDTTLRFEIVQIGAIKLDMDFRTVDSFRCLVKPTQYPEVSPFITELTGIQTEQLQDQEKFPKVYEAFLDFIGDPDAIYCVWGNTDVKELFRNVDYHKLDQNLLPKWYIDIQPLVSLHLGFSNKTRLRLQYAVEALHIEQKYPYHDAYYDTYYTAELFKKVYQPFLQPKLYLPNEISTSSRPPRQIKKRIDFRGLFLQFEKMYHREITEEEKDMIRLSYQMGKTHQFLVEEKPNNDEK